MFHSSLFQPESLCNTLILLLCLLPFPTLLPASQWVGENHLRRLLLLREIPALRGRTFCPGRIFCSQKSLLKKPQRKMPQHLCCCSQAPRGSSSWLMPFQTNLLLQLEMSGTRLMVTCGSCRCLEQPRLIYFRVEFCFPPMLNLKRALHP